MIDTSKHLFDAFGSMETEISARWVVRLCQKLNSWGPFTMKQLEGFYHESRSIQETFWFNGLTTEWIVRTTGGYSVTDDFILRCYRSSPMPIERQEQA